FTTVNNTHYRKIVINGDWEGVDSGEKHDLVARAIIYSPSPRFVYWYLNKRVCDATPDQCGGDFLPKERLQVLFIGEQTAIVDHLAQFNVSNFSATQIAGAKAGFGVHRISW
ncbi:MAG: hypothetical protein P8L39_17740, partial [Halioglobus sp.]|nr:hypothetical protein [Halioglobus sp.]